MSGKKIDSICYFREIEIICFNFFSNLQSWVAVVDLTLRKDHVELLKRLHNLYNFFFQV